MTTEQVLQKAWEEYKKLYAESYRLYAEANRLWREAVKGVHGDMVYKWKNLDGKRQSLECRLANGEIYRTTKEESR